MSIYEDILELEQEIDSCFDPETGEIIEEKEQELIKNLETRGVGGLEYLCKSRANLISDINGLKEEASRITYKQKNLETKLTSREKYILLILEKLREVLKKDKIEAGSYTVGTRKSSRIMIEDESNFDVDGYFTIKEEKKIDKKKIKEDLDKGIDIKGAYIQENQNLTVK